MQITSLHFEFFIAIISNACFLLAFHFLKFGQWSRDREQNACTYFLFFSGIILVIYYYLIIYGVYQMGPLEHSTKPKEVIVQSVGVIVQIYHFVTIIFSNILKSFRQLQSMHSSSCFTFDQEQIQINTRCHDPPSPMLIWSCYLNIMT